MIKLDHSRLTNDSAELLQLSLEETLTEVASTYGLTLRGHLLKTKLSNLVADMASGCHVWLYAARNCSHILKKLSRYC
ncbi:hypothetical protein [Cardinium endosymbiont of Nabis limbatus]|uniref:hypothetical protein n=1 Tax=Cardinium endosymbiont of Nabis limbatus TaxID=3066217 RepID=UPI003AF3AEA7